MDCVNFSVTRLVGVWAERTVRKLPSTEASARADAEQRRFEQWSRPLPRPPSSRKHQEPAEERLPRKLSKEQQQKLVDIKSAFDNINREQRRIERKTTALRRVIAASREERKAMRLKEALASYKRLVSIHPQTRCISSQGGGDDELDRTCRSNSPRALVSDL